ncbi:hypothetical protein [uncultured Aquimarina sp.]|uniref:hypothetical protein n=1 Tax=uncultured Aquimarina sp. TaxID=575652 RepID=UPI00262CC1A4|nr:hypothetical protein [uncultured Aquimarina sp.]
MSLENKVLELLNTLNKEQKKSFGIFCLERVLSLYKKVDETENLNIVDSSIKKGEAYKRLESIFNEVKNKEISDIDKLIEACDPLILDTEEIFDNTSENEISGLVAQGLDYLLNFEQSEDEEFIEYCSSNNIEILNQLKAREYYVQSNFKANDDEIMNYVKPLFEKEYEIQIQAINFIKEQNLEGIKNLIKANLIEWSN